LPLRTLAVDIRRQVEICAIPHDTQEKYEI